MKRVHRFVSNDFTIRAASVDATDVVKAMQSIQGTMPIPTVAVGKAMVGALLMASQFKADQSLGVYFKGDGPLLGVYADASFEGKVRGYTPQHQYQPKEYKSLSTAEAIGRGTLTVVRHLPFQKQPHSGTVEIQTGEIGDDIAYYLDQSQQIRSIISLGVYLDPYGRVLSAGGIMIEVMPGVEDEVVNKLESNAKKINVNVSKSLHEGKHPVELVIPFMEGIPFTELDHNYPLEFFCPCTEERVIDSLVILGEEDLQDMIQKNEPAEVMCQMCGKPYQIGIDKLAEVKNKLRKESLH